MSLRHLAIAAVGLSLLTACAPDAMNNRAATGFNGYLDTINRVCAPMSLGMAQLSNPLMGGVRADQYNYWLDQTSRLYYRTLSPEAYRDSINAFFGGGNNTGTLDCIINNLPQQR